MAHTIEKIGGTSMSNFAAVRDNVVLNGKFKDNPYNRVFVVSAYGGITNYLLEHKKTGEPGIYALFANIENQSQWEQALQTTEQKMADINAELFSDSEQLAEANAFLADRIAGAHACLSDLQRLCSYGHFQLDEHLMTVRELLASIGEAHSAYNMAFLLRNEGVNARFVDLSGWKQNTIFPLDQKIKVAFADINVAQELPIVTGYAQCKEGLMKSFDRGYSEMTFSRLAVITQAAEAIIHKEYHLSSADPRLVGEDKAVPIGRTNYDVADQLANLGMEAIHPKAAKGLRQSGIPLRVKNTFEPDHTGTLITSDYVGENPCVEIIAGRTQVYALEVFDQNMVGDSSYDRRIMDVLASFKAKVISKDVNANTITHYIDSNKKVVNRIIAELEAKLPSADVSFRTVAIVSAIGSNMKVPGILAETVKALADVDISVLAMHQSMRQVDMQFVVADEDYDKAVQSLHQCLIEPHNHEYAICAAGF